MPRLPTIRVIGSHDMSTRLPDEARTSFSGVMTVAIDGPPSSGRDGGRWMIPGGQLGAVVPPLRLLVRRVVGALAELSEDPAGEPDACRRQPRARGLVHERHELVGEPGHRAADADPAVVGAAADPG